MEQIIRNYLDEAAETFRTYKKLAETAAAQTSDAEFFASIDREANSIAAIFKHIGGNLRSRWTDFLTADGEKADRNRDAEFVAATDTREFLHECWENGWSALFRTLASLTAADCAKTVRIRGEELSVAAAVNRSLAHTASHVGQIILLAKHFRSADWQTLSIPKNKSAEFNRRMSVNEKAGDDSEAAENDGAIR